MSLSRVTSIALLSLPLLLGAVPQSFAETPGFIGHAPAVDSPGHKEWTWDGDRSLAVDVPGVLHYQRSGPARIVITGPEELLRNVRVGDGRITSDGDWPWHWGANWGGNDKLDITVSGIPLDNLAVSGSAKLLLGHLDQDSLNLHISGSGSASAEGRIAHLRLSISGSGNAAR